MLAKLHGASTQIWPRSGNRAEVLSVANGADVTLTLNLSMFLRF